MPFFLLCLKRRICTGFRVNGLFGKENGQNGEWIGRNEIKKIFYTGKKERDLGTFLNKKTRFTRIQMSFNVFLKRVKKD